MFRYAITLAAASLLFSLPFSNPVHSADTDLALARNSMRLFGGPSMAYPRIGLITWGQGLRVLGCVDEKWCEVIADGQRGWVQTEKLNWVGETSRKGSFLKAPARVTI